MAVKKKKTIAEHVAAGGKLPGEKGFDKKAVEKDVAARKPAPTKKKESLDFNIGKPKAFGTGAVDIITPKTFTSKEEAIKGLKRTGIAAAAVGAAVGVGAAASALLGGGAVATISGGPWTNPQWNYLSSQLSGSGYIWGKSAIAQAAKVGTSGISKVATGTAGKIAVNAATKAATTTWLSKLAAFATNPTVIVSGLIGAIGSYPFAGFIKEEALQTLGFGIRTATASGDIEGAEEAIALQKEILDPSMWDEIKNGIPYANVLNQLGDFYKSAETKLSIDEKMVSDMKTQIETGESDDDKWKRLRQEQADQEKANIDYYNQERKKMVEFEREAAKEARDADAKFWAKEREKQREKEEEDRKAIADFWQAYRKESAKIAEDNRPSKLNFGLI